MKAETREIYDPFMKKMAVITDKLTDRLRGKYAVGPIMDNGEPEFGWNQYPTVSIQLEAADRIEALEEKNRQLLMEINDMQTCLFPCTD